MTRATVSDPADVIVVVRGRISDRAKVQAQRALAGLASNVDGRVLLARVALTRIPDPNRGRPALAKAVLDVDGDPIRAHVSAPRMDQAITLLERRLRDQLEHRSRYREARRQRSSTSPDGVWRHGDVPAPRPERFPRPPEDRELVRHKSYALGELTCDEAALEMDLLDHDFHLFVHAVTGRDAVLWRLDADSYELMETEPIDDAVLATCVAPVRAAAAPAPLLSLRDAIRRLEDGGEDAVFFVDRASGRGTVVYLRYDGHYGLLTPGSRPGAAAQ